MKYSIILQNYLNTFQQSTTSGIGGFFIHNNLDIPLNFSENDLNNITINPHDIHRYTGVYHNGIPFGAVLKFVIENENEFIEIDKQISDIQINY